MSQVEVSQPPLSPQFTNTSEFDEISKAETLEIDEEISIIY